MGRKGGGRAGFVKAAARRPQSDDESDQPLPPAAEAIPASGPPSGSSKTTNGDKAAPSISSKAAAFLKDPPPTTAPPPVAGDDSYPSDDDGKGASTGESRGQMLQRHKREVKALKDQIKRLGKKAKDEAAKMEAEMEKRHAAELASLNTVSKAGAADVVAVADSLYAVTLDDDKKADGKKPTKAQKRREQKLKEEAERDARIAAELAELGETERAAEERELLAVLKPLQLGVHDIPPDGHCLYRSLEHQLLGLGDSGVSALSAAAAASCCDPEDPASFLTLRQVAAEYMRQHASDFAPFLTQGEVSEVPEGTDGSAAGGGGSHNESSSFEAYCNAVENTAAWGGHLEIQALSKALQVHIQVFSVGMPTLELGEEFKGNKPTLTVCYLKHAYGLGEHYNSVVPAEEGSSDEDL